MNGRAMNQLYGNQISRNYERNNRNIAEKTFEEMIFEKRPWKRNEPSQEAKSSNNLPLTFYDLPSLRNMITPLLFEEVRSCLVEGKKGKSFPVKVCKSIRTDRDNSFRHRITFVGSLPPDEEIGFVANAMMFHAKEKCGSMTFFGLADRVNDNNLKVRFHLSNAVIASKSNLFSEGIKWSATYITCLVTFRRIYETLTSNKFSALSNSMNYDLCQGKLAITSCEESRQLQSLLKDLNSSQQIAIQQLVSAKEGFSVLQGPPGTGKTTTVLSLIASLLQQHKDQQRKRILVSAPSNKAVQVIAERFSKIHPDVRMVLNGRESKVNSNLRSIFLQYMLEEQIQNLKKALSGECVEEVKETEGITVFKTETLLNELQIALTELQKIQDFLRKWQFECQPIEEALELYKRKRIHYLQKRDSEYIILRSLRWKQFLESKENVLLKIDALNCEDTFLSKADVIFATLSVCGRPNMSKIGRIDVLIIDEAGQSVEAEALIPIIQHNPQRVILVGDTKQLPATVSSSAAKEKKYDRSLMERFELQSSKSIIMLDEQFRMDRNICSWPSQQYYAGRLSTASKVSENRETRCLHQPIAFYNIEGKEEKVGTSRINKLEAKYVIECIQHLLYQSSPAHSSSSGTEIVAATTDSSSTTPSIATIGVISYYAAQVDLLTNMIHKNFHQKVPKISVNTVDGFQGDECDIIILSSVCSNPKGDIGFLSDPRRLNVAITRSKHVLIILGHESTLIKKPNDLKTLIENLERRSFKFSMADLDKFLGKQPQQLPKNKFKNNSIGVSKNEIDDANVGVLKKRNKKEKTKKVINSAVLASTAAISAHNNSSALLTSNNSFEASTQNPGSRNKKQKRERKILKQQSHGHEAADGNKVKNRAVPSILSSLASASTNDAQKHFGRHKRRNRTRKGKGHAKENDSERQLNEVSNRMST